MTPRLLVATRRLALGLATLTLTACSDADSGGVAVENTLEACTDGADNDGDGFTDCDDQDCWVFVACADSTDTTSGGDADGSDASGDTTAGEDAAGEDTTAQDSSATDTGSVACDASCTPGSVVGVVCAPNPDITINDAQVTIEGSCGGQPFLLEAQSAADGSYAFDEVPCGVHTFTVTKGSFERSGNIEVLPGEELDLTDPLSKQCFRATDTPIAVLDGQWDDLGGLLDDLGLAYDFFNKDGVAADGTYVDLLTDAEALATYEVIFINCGGDHGWMPQDNPDAMQPLKDWVLAGGSLYMSDYAWVYGEWSFPDAIEFQRSDDVGDMYTDQSPQLIPTDQTVQASVVDGSMAALLGSASMTVTFDQGPQIAPSMAGAGTFAHVIGTFPPLTALGTDFEPNDVPLVLSYRPTETAGRVVYTNFHNDAQTTSEMLTILNYLVFTL